MAAPAVAEHLRQSADILSRASQQTAEAEQLASRICQALRAGKKVVIFGNGGSAADSQHFAAELVGRFEKERSGLSAIALTTDTSILTAVANDFGADQIFARQVQALVHPDDVVVAISTSGNSRNILEGVVEAKRRKAWTAGLTGLTGGQLKSLVDLCICVPSPRTAHIQECHIALIHAVCACVDAAFLTTTI